MFLMKFEIVCDSSADLSPSYIQQNHITVVPFYVSLDGETYQKEGVDLSIPDFYQAMIDHPDCFPKSSMPSIQDYMDAFLPFVQRGIPVLCICLTQKFSGSYQSALSAKNAILDDYPHAQVYVMDSQLVTALQGLLVMEAVRLRDKELTLSHAVPLLEEVRGTGHIFFTTNDLKYLEHGGRLGKVACIAGSMLNLKPLLHFSNGELGTTEICRGRRKSLQKVTEKFVAYLKDNDINLEGYLFCTGVGIDLAEYDDFKAYLTETFEKVGLRPEVCGKAHIGSTIGVHTGPYPIGLGFLKKCSI